ncbi:hypothetical protein [Halopiger djelfimassiliensis]|uniref:hypothetical protein n=1 Tax=Halopiger djelfimassiliensis TaxID=1293047 RepID=UPI000AF4A920|nr:hypothetical protein [Halopiger djelfimassiliensis]
MVLFGALALGSAIAAPFDDGSGDPQQSLVATDDDSSLWPYTSRATAFEERTLPINVFVGGDPSETRRYLEQRSRGEWDAPTSEEADVSDETPGFVGTETAWSRADGSTRYVYIDHSSDDEPTDSDGGRWLAESYQLHDGEYLGSRHHIRAYAPEDDDEWTAIQAHSEHWDWFRLSHTVDSVETSQRYVEREFMGHGGVGNVTRVHLGNDRGSDANGWVTIVDFDGEPPFHLVLLGLLPGAVLTRRRSIRDLVRTLCAAQAPQKVVLPASLIGLYLFVRFGAIAVETRLGGVDPRLIAVAFYPLLAVGLPVCAYSFARVLDRQTAFAVSAVGFAIAILLDYTLLGVTRLPVNAFVHRFSTAIALGFIAAGASHTARVDPVDHDFVRLGVLLWLVTLLVPLLRFL